MGLISAISKLIDILAVLALIALVFIDPVVAIAWAAVLGVAFLLRSRWNAADDESDDAPLEEVEIGHDSRPETPPGGNEPHQDRTSNGESLYCPNCGEDLSEWLSR